MPTCKQSSTYNYGGGRSRERDYDYYVPPSLLALELRPQESHFYLMIMAGFHITPCHLSYPGGHCQLGVGVVELDTI